MKAVSLALLTLVPLGLSSPSTGERPRRGTDSFPAGEVTERIVTLSNANHSYALYLPPGYDGEKKFPLLIGMDPRGDALYPLDRMRPAAERFGYVIASSHNTLSDGPPNPNREAVEAILADARARLSIDFRRIYLVGFSGTARISWIFGYALRGRVAGLIGLGAGLPPGLDLGVAVEAHGTPFGFFGGAGLTDFNYEEVRTLDETLDRYHLPHRIEFYPGPHAWPPAEVFTRAIEWMELQAMRRNLTPENPAWIAARYHAGLKAAHAEEEAGRDFAALRRYRALAEDFDALIDTTAAASRAGELERSKAVRKTIRKQARLATEYRLYVGKLRRFLADIKTADPGPRREESLYELQINSLKRVAEKSPDEEERFAARRLLALAFVQTSFYETRRFLEAGDPERAVALLGIAAAIQPEDPRVCYQLARAHAQAGRVDEAVRNLECVAAAGRPDPARIETDEWLAPLREEARFREFLERLRGG